mmetsp:Transcript_40637/g.61937  ORF Transcript_40637/g.61937 Transcript_40637/m.61937 type:complete len:81 (+) Transcript_40637:2039-2281(+)
MAQTQKRAAEAKLAYFIESQEDAQMTDESGHQVNSELEKTKQEFEAQLAKKEEVISKLKTLFREVEKKGAEMEAKNEGLI